MPGIRISVGWVLKKFLSGGVTPPVNVKSSLFGKRLFGPRLFGKKLMP